MKHSRAILNATLIALIIALGGSLNAQIINGDFSSGLDNWTVVQLPSNLIVSGALAPFDIDGSGPLGSSDAFTASVGLGDQRSLRQDVFLFTGVTYRFAADIGVIPESNNADGGYFSIFVGPTLITSFWFGGTTFGINEYASLSATYVPALTGAQNLAIDITRGFGAGGGTPINFIDNIRFAPVPEPSSVAFFWLGTLAFGASCLLRRKHK